MIKFAWVKQIDGMKVFGLNAF